MPPNRLAPEPSSMLFEPKLEELAYLEGTGARTRRPMSQQEQRDSRTRTAAAGMQRGGDLEDAEGAMQREGRVRGGREVGSRGMRLSNQGGAAEGGTRGHPSMGQQLAQEGSWGAQGQQPPKTLLQLQQQVRSG